MKVDLVFADPPYGMGKESDGVENDNLYNEKLLAFNRKWIPLSFEALKENGSWYCWGIDKPLLDIYAELIRPMVLAKKVTFRNLITWDKGNGQGQMSPDFRMYAPADEKCIFVMCGSEAAQGFTVNKEDYSPAMDKVRLYMVGEAERLGITPQKIKEITGYGMYGHWFTKSQFCIPTRESYEKLREYYAAQDGFKKEYDGFKKEYDDLKKEFYASRSYFDNTHDNMNSVWHFDRTSEEERKLTGGARHAQALGALRPGHQVVDPQGGDGLRPLRRVRVHPDRLPATRQEVPHDGIGRTLLRCDN